jgi:hypothetical protein
VKNILLAATAVSLLASPVIAQNRVIVTDPVTTGSVRGAPFDGSVQGSSTSSPHSRTQGNNSHGGGNLVPSYQQGSNQEAGGPANELNPGR